MREVISILRKSLGLMMLFVCVHNIQAQTELIIKANALCAESKWTDCLGLTEQILTKTKDSISWHKSLHLKGKALKGLLRLPEAQKVLLRCENYMERHPEIAEPYVGDVYNDLGDLYMYFNQIDRAKKYLNQAIKYADQFNKGVNRTTTRSYNLLGICSDMQGKYDEAISLYKKTLDTNGRLNDYSEKDDEKALSNMANSYGQMREFRLRDETFRKLEEILLRNYGQCSQSLYILYFNMNGAFNQLGAYDDALEVIDKACFCVEKLHGKDHPHYAEAALVKGEELSRRSKFEEAEKLITEAADILESINGALSQEVLDASNSLGILYYNQSQLRDSELQFKKSKYIMDQLGIAHTENYARVLNYLGNIYCQKGMLKEGIASLEESLKICEEYDHDQNKLLSDLAITYLQNDEAEAAAKVANRKFDLLKKNSELFFEFLSEKERQGYVSNIIEPDVFAIRRLSRIEDKLNINELQFDLALFQKGLDLETSVNTTEFILSQNNPELLKYYSQLLQAKKEIAIEYQLPKKERSNLQNLTLQKEMLEKTLAKASYAFRSNLDNKRINASEVKKTLKDNEAALEFIHYHDSQLDSTFYYAAILSSNNDEVDYTYLFEERALEKYLGDTKIRKSEFVEEIYSVAERGLKTKKETIDLYELIWKPLEPSLKGISKIYFSPSGLLNRLNLSAVAINDFESVLDKYKLVQLSSTRLLAVNQEQNQINSLMVMGAINYDVDSTHSSYDTYQTRAYRGNKDKAAPPWSYLKWTEQEIKKIGSIAEENEIELNRLDGSNASEAAFKKMGSSTVSPSIIHLATHGYFFPKPPKGNKALNELVFKNSKEALMRSGLILADGNHVWTGGDPLDSVDDGILTALEISQLNLSQTQLVVLSACETGLGDIKGSEGVYGLQRAFKKAGVRNMIISLWQVPDRETSVFMTTFYEAWLTDKLSISDAFIKTQKEMRDRFFNPYQWAGFILIE